MIKNELFKEIRIFAKFGSQRKTFFLGKVKNDDKKEIPYYEEIATILFALVTFKDCIYCN